MIAFVATLWTSALHAQNVNMDRFITLKVKEGTQIKMKMKAASNNIAVRIVSGSEVYNLTVGTSETILQEYRAGAATMTIYGNITEFDCAENSFNLTAVDPSKNPMLTLLRCYNNQLTELNVTQLEQLEWLYCQNNQLTELNLSQNKRLGWLSCYGNRLTSLDLRKNKMLIWLYCENNSLELLDISQNKYVTEIKCQNNRLASLDISQNTNLNTLYCQNNQFSTQAIEDIYCALPNRKNQESGTLVVVNDSKSANHATVMATTAKNATAKNWKLVYGSSINKELPVTSGNYICGSFGLVINGVEITTANYKNINGDAFGIKEGSVTYDPAKKTLTLENAKIHNSAASGNEAIGIWNRRVDGLKIVLIGDNSVQSDNYSGIINGEKLGMTITGAGKLNVAGSTKGSRGIYSMGTLTIDATDVTAIGLLGIAGSGKPESILTINNSSVTAQGNQASISNFNTLTLVGSNITQPADAIIEGGAVKKDGMLVNTEVAIKPQTNNVAKTEISTLAFYPNPVADVLYIRTVAAVHSIQVYNMYGAEVAVVVGSKQINLVHLTAGVYSVRVETTQGTETMRVIKK